MKTTLDKVENNTAYLTVEVPAAMVEEALERAFRRLSRNILIPGFRRGRAPRALVERRIGRQALLDEALDDLLPEAYAQAVRETGIEPIDRPTVTDIHYEEGQPLSFKAQVEVKPEVTLGDYRSIRVERPQVQVDEADVNNLLERLREAQAQLVPVDDEAEAAEGHVAVIDFKGTVDGQPFPGGEGQDYMVEIGAGRLVEGFEQQLIGMRVGQERDIDVTFPEDHPEAGLAGKAARFHVTLKELKRKELPALDDEFARSVGEFQTLEELRADVEKNLRRRAEEDAQEQVRQEVIRQVVEQAQVDLPAVLVERRLDQLVEDFRRRVEAQGMKWEDYLRRQGETVDDLRREFRPRAEREVKADLVLDAVARRENITAGDDDLNAEAVRLAEAYGQPVEEMRRLMSRPDVRAEVEASLRVRKTIDYLVELATQSG
ncbi:MAG: trigger factor [Thermaerobacter sp.]